MEWIRGSLVLQLERWNTFHFFSMLAFGNLLISFGDLVNGVLDLCGAFSFMFLLLKQSFPLMLWSSLMVVEVSFSKKYSLKTDFVLAKKKRVQVP